MPGLTEADKTTIRDTSQKVLDIANNKPTDWDAYTRMYYTEDAVVMPPNTPVVTGRAAIRDFLSGMPPITNFKIVDVEIDGSEDKAWVYGTYAMQVYGSVAQRTRRCLEGDSRHVQLGSAAGGRLTH